MDVTDSGELNGLKLLIKPDIASLNFKRSAGEN